MVRNTFQRRFPVAVGGTTVARRNSWPAASTLNGSALRRTAPGSPCLNPHQHVVVIPGAQQPETDRVAHVGSAVIGKIGQTKARGSGREQAGDLLMRNEKQLGVY